MIYLLLFSFHIRIRFFFLSARVRSTHWFQTENFISSFETRVKQNITHTYNRILTRDADKKQTMEHWLISISSNDGDEKRRGIAVPRKWLRNQWTLELHDGAQENASFFLFWIHNLLIRWLKRSPKTFFILQNWVEQFYWIEKKEKSERNEIRFKTKMKIESDLSKWKFNSARAFILHCLKIIKYTASVLLILYISFVHFTFASQIKMKSFYTTTTTKKWNTILGIPQEKWRKTHTNSLKSKS